MLGGRSGDVGGAPYRDIEESKIQKPDRVITQTKKSAKSVRPDRVVTQLESKKSTKSVKPKPTKSSFSDVEHDLLDDYRM